MMTDVESLENITFTIDIEILQITEIDRKKHRYRIYEPKHIQGILSGINDKKDNRKVMNMMMEFVNPDNNFMHYM